jgi:hypothetical protein
MLTLKIYLIINTADKESKAHFLEAAGTPRMAVRVLTPTKIIFCLKTARYSKQESCLKTVFPVAVKSVFFFY